MQTEKAPPHCTGVVLLAEDEAEIRTLISTVLQRDGFIVLVGCDGAEALNLSRQRSERIDLLLTDVQMGDGITGIELAELIRQDRSGIAVLVISGLPASGPLAAAKGYAFLPKPFAPATLTGRVRELLAKVPAQSERKPEKREMTG